MTLDMTSLDPGFRAVVIGAGGGIGAALCEALRALPRLGELVELSRREDGFDITDEASIAAQAQALSGRPVHLLFCATGILQRGGHPPEKALRQIDPENMLDVLRVNAVGPALIAKHFFPLLPRSGRSISAFLSARVGSIEDNRLGGWISYRTSKAALNQIVRTAAVELNRTHPRAVVAAVHPGTVRTAFSAAFSKGRDTLLAQDAAASILGVVDRLPETGKACFVAYDGAPVAW